MGNRSDRRTPLTLKQLKQRGDQRIAEAQQAVAAAFQIAQETEKILARLQQGELRSVSQ